VFRRRMTATIGIPILGQESAREGVGYAVQGCGTDASVNRRERALLHPTGWAGHSRVRVGPRGIPFPY
jgi:hypothetical protein